MPAAGPPAPVALPLHRLAEQQASVQAELAERETSAGAQQARIRQAADLVGDAETLERLERESGVLQKRAEEQRKQLSHIGGGASKTLDQLSDEVLAAEEHLEEEERKRDSYAAKQQRATAEVALVRMLARCRGCSGRACSSHPLPRNLTVAHPLTRARTRACVCWRAMLCVAAAGAQHRGHAGGDDAHRGARAAHGRA
jgi:hypothetical protein